MRSVIAGWLLLTGFVRNGGGEFHELMIGRDRGRGSFLTPFFDNVEAVCVMLDHAERGESAVVIVE
jgi:hypothetical protein